MRAMTRSQCRDSGRSTNQGVPGTEDGSKLLENNILRITIIESIFYGGTSTTRIEQLQCFEYFPREGRKSLRAGHELSRAFSIFCLQHIENKYLILVFALNGTNIQDAHVHASLDCRDRASVGTDSQDSG